MVIVLENRDAPDNGFNLDYFIDFFAVFLDFFQMLNFSFLDEFTLKSSEDSLFSFEWMNIFFDTVKGLVLNFYGLMPLIIFFVFIFLIWVIVVPSFILLLDKYLYNLKCWKYYESLIGWITDHVPFIFKTVLFDFLYIPVMSSLFNVFICTYHCDFKPGSLEEDEAYPPLDIYTAISCNSPPQIICFIFAFIGVAIYHILASYYVCFELDEEYSGNTVTNQRFQYVRQIGKV